MILGSLIVPLFMLVVYEDSLRELGRFNYAINFLLLNPLAPLASPTTLAQGMANLANSLSQQDHLREELILLSFPLMIMLLTASFATRLLRLARRLNPAPPGASDASV
jgi:hypothetical protein